MSIEKEIDEDFIYITDDDIVKAITYQAQEEAKILIRNDLNEYVKVMGIASTFKGWISHICPENVEIDLRLERENSDWHKIWNDAVIKYNNKDNISIMPVTYYKTE